MANCDTQCIKALQSCDREWHHSFYATGSLVLGQEPFFVSLPIITCFLLSTWSNLYSFFQLWRYEHVIRSQWCGNSSTVRLIDGRKKISIFVSIIILSFFCHSYVIWLSFLSQSCHHLFFRRCKFISNFRHRHKVVSSVWHLAISRFSCWSRARDLIPLFVSASVCRPVTHT